MVRDPFPFAAAATVLALLRALYRDERKAGASGEQLATIAAVGESLKSAIDLARQGSPGSLGQSIAWHKATDATLAACNLLGERLKEPGGVAAVQKIRRLG